MTKKSKTGSYQSLLESLETLCVIIKKALTVLKDVDWVAVEKIDFFKEKSALVHSSLANLL